MVEQRFVVIQRNRNNEINTFVSDNLVDAVALQKALLVGAPVGIVKPTITEKEIDAVVVNLNKFHQDRLATDEEEVLLVLLPKRESMR